MKKNLGTLIDPRIFEQRIDTGVVHLPRILRCDVEDCDQRGQHQTCYLETNKSNCSFYNELRGCYEG